MNVTSTVHYLEQVKATDAAFEAEKIKTTGATLCCECHANKPVRQSPFWHRYGRSLCDACSKDYSELLKSLGAVDSL